MTIKVEPPSGPSPKSWKPSGLYLMELRSHRVSERESRQKLADSTSSAGFKEAVPSAEKKIRS